MKYEETVKNSLLEVEDLLGSFDLSPIKKPISPQTTPTKHTSVEVKDGSEFAQEVEVPLYDSDSLPSPPSSEGASSGAEEPDELMDFTRDDEFNYNPAFESDYTKEGLEAPRMMKAMFQAKHGIEVRRKGRRGGEGKEGRGGEGRGEGKGGGGEGKEGRGGEGKGGGRGGEGREGRRGRGGDGKGGEEMGREGRGGDGKGGEGKEWRRREWLGWE